MSPYFRTILAVGASICAVIRVWMLFDRRKHWRTARGTVVDIAKIDDPERPTRAPIVQFATFDGKDVTFRESISSSPLLLRKGSSVVVRYHPQFPTQATIVGWREYAPPLLFALGAAFVVAWAFRA